MNKTRLSRIDDEIMKEMAALLSGELNDPRLKRLITVTRVKTTSDLRYCKIYVSVMGTDDEKSQAMEGFLSCAGFLRSQLAERINLRQTPELTFVLDDSLDESIRISKILDGLK